MLEIKNLHASVDGKEILRGIDLSVKAGEVPDVIGMGARDAVFQMEKAGLHATLQGTGSVVRQSLPAGTPAVRGKTVRLELSTDVHRKKTHPRRVTREKADSLATRGAGPHVSADTTKKKTAS